MLRLMHFGQMLLFNWWCISISSEVAKRYPKNLDVLQAKENNCVISTETNSALKKLKKNNKVMKSMQLKQKPGEALFW